MAGIDFLPKEYGYIVLLIVTYCVLNYWMQVQIGKARKKYGVSYPTLYATEADTKEYKKFNCIQRGHQNSLEVMPKFFALLILAGIKHPLIASALGAVYIVSRYFYFTGYSSGDPQNRLPLGRFNALAILGLMICNISFGVSLLRRE